MYADREGQDGERRGGGRGRGGRRGGRGGRGGYGSERREQDVQFYDQASSLSRTRSDDVGRSSGGGYRGYDEGMSRSNSSYSPQDDEYGGGRNYGPASTSSRSGGMGRERGGRRGGGYDGRYQQHQSRINEVPERVANRVLGQARRDMRRQAREEEEERIRKEKEEEERQRKEEAEKWERYRDYKAKAMKEKIAKGPVPNSRGFGAGRGKRIPEEEGKQEESMAGEEGLVVEGGEEEKTRPRQEGEEKFENEE
mmetsp:Transcript_31849/g.83135  ORF Transcript_31849/g.83135 Transcript_31849/m.83135 type:complete len:253 (-) Transcript_31849:1439-2197(-)